MSANNTAKRSLHYNKKSDRNKTKSPDRVELLVTVYKISRHTWTRRICRETRRYNVL